MTEKARIKVAAAVTALFLVAMSAAGVVAHRSNHPAVNSTPKQYTSSSGFGVRGQTNPPPARHEQEHD